VSLVLPSLAGTLSSTERAEREKLAARLDGHLGHNGLISRPLFHKWAAFLLDLMAEGKFTIAVPSLHDLELESLAVVNSIYQVYADRAPPLVVGYDPEGPDPEADDDGIVWPLPRAAVLTTALTFQAEPDAEILDLAAAKSPKVTGASWLDDQVSYTDEDLEAQAYLALRGSTDSRPGELATLVVPAMQAAFRAYGWTSALRLGVELLAQGPELTPAHAAEVHGIVGLAAHNRQFRTESGNSRLEAFLERHFRLALESEKRPAIRSAHSYRLAVTLGRRHKDFEAALPWADKAIEEARAPGLVGLQSAYLEAWGRNIRAFVLAFTGRSQQAVEDAETAFALLEDAADQAPHRGDETRNPWDAEFSRVVLAHNLVALGLLNGDMERALRWQQTACEIDAEYPGIAKLEAKGWLALYSLSLRFDLALPQVLKGLTCAQADRDLVMEFRLTRDAGDVCYRLGEAERAHEFFERARELRARLGNPPSLLPQEVSMAAAAVRAGRYEAARQVLEHALADPWYQWPDAQAEVLAWIGLMHAAAGEGRKADSAMDQAIDRAVESGKRDTLLRIAVAAGSACRLLGRPKEAEEAYRRAVDLAKVDDAGGAPPPAAEWLRAELGLSGHAGAESDPERLVQALRLLPEALQDEECWWDLSRLARRVRSVSTLEPEALESDDLVEPLEKLVIAASQRKDCAEEIRELRAVLGEKAPLALGIGRERVKLDRRAPRTAPRNSDWPLDTPTAV